MNNNTLSKVEAALFFLVLLLLPTQLGKHFWPNFAFVFSLPVDYLSPTIYFWDVILILLLLTHGINLRRNKNHTWIPATMKYVVLYCFLSGISLLTANNIGAGMFRLEQLILMTLFAYYLAVYPWKSLLTVINLPLILAFILESSIAVAEFFHQGSVGLWILGERTFRITTPAIAKFNLWGLEMLRPYATFPHPNVLAGFLTVVSPLLLKINTKSNKRAFISVLTIIVIFLTSSRPAILIQFINIVKWLLSLKKHFRAFTITLLLVLIPFFYVRFGSLINYDNLSFVRREDLMYSAWAIFINHPLFGVGLNNFIPELSSMPAVSGEGRFLQPVHNILLLQLSETGIVGFLGLSILLGHIIYRLWQNKNEQFGSLLITLWAAMLFLGMFDHYFLTLPQGLRLLFLLLGLSMSYDVSHERDKKSNSTNLLADPR